MGFFRTAPPLTAGRCKHTNARKEVPKKLMAFCGRKLDFFPPSGCSKLLVTTRWMTWKLVIFRLLNPYPYAPWDWDILPTFGLNLWYICHDCILNWGGRSNLHTWTTSSMKPQKWLQRQRPRCCTIPIPKLLPQNLTYPLNSHQNPIGIRTLPTPPPIFFQG